MNNETPLSETSSAYEIATHKLQKFIDSIQSLEDEKVIKNVRIVMYGSAVSEFKSPSDMDVLVLYDPDLINLDEDIPTDNLDETSQKILHNLMYGGKRGELDFDLGVDTKMEVPGIEYHFMTYESFQRKTQYQQFKDRQDEEDTLKHLEQTNRENALNMLRGLCRDKRITEEDDRKKLRVITGLLALVNDKPMEDFIELLIPLVKDQNNLQEIHDFYEDNRKIKPESMKQIKLECFRTLSEGYFSPELSVLLSKIGTSVETEKIDEQEAITRMASELCTHIPYPVQKLLKSQIYHYYTGTNWVQTLVESGTVLLKGENIQQRDGSNMFGENF